MVNFFETRSYWQGGFTEEQHEYYHELFDLARLSLRLCDVATKGKTALPIRSLGKYRFYLYSLYCYCYQWLTSLKLDLIGKAGSRRNNGNFIRNIACLKKRYIYGK